MKKSIVWFIAGCIAATSFSAYAEEAIESMIGKQVNGVVNVDLYGKAMKSVLIDGVTYVPLREFAESRGDLVSYSEETGVKIKKRISGDRESFTRAIAGLKSSSMTASRMLGVAESELDKLKAKPQTQDGLNDIKATEDRIKKTKEDISRYEKSLAQLEQQLTEFDAQQASQP